MFVICPPTPTPPPTVIEGVTSFTAHSGGDVAAVFAVLIIVGIVSAVILFKNRKLGDNK